jgi:ribosomal protein S18 acetylase RimI-like enzyme
MPRSPRANARVGRSDGRNVEIRRIRADEGPRLKALRLAALADSPDAFGTTLADSRRETDRYWHERAELGALSADDIIVVAVERDEWWGLARGSWEAGPAGTVELGGVWVHPDRRRSGIAAQLCEAVANWASQSGATQLQLWVTETNVAARGLYVRLAFAETGDIQRHPSNPALREIRMVRRVHGYS